MTYKDDKSQTETKIFIARQPIFDRQKNVYAYELLYRSDLENRAYITDDKFATLKVIANSLLMGLQKLTAGKRAFIHFNRDLLLGDFTLSFPKELLGVEILDIREPEKQLIQVCKDLKKTGYLLVLDGVILGKKENRHAFVPLADIIKVDFLANPPGQRWAMVRKIKNENSPDVRLLAEKVETRNDYKEALKLGFHYFQGYFFQKPDLISRKEIPGHKINYLQLLKKIHQRHLDFPEIEEIIKRDASLTYKLLRFINSASYGFQVTVRSIGHALVLLGQRELRKWLTIIVMSGIGNDKPLELMTTAIVRARFCELIASEFKLQYQPWDFFLMGMFSLMDAFLDRPMEEILEELPLEDNVKDALLGKDPHSGDFLGMVEAFEKAQWEPVTQMAEKLSIPEDKLSSLYIDAVDWTKFLSTANEK